VLDRQYEAESARFTVKIGRRHIDMLLARGAEFTIDQNRLSKRLSTYGPNHASHPP